MQNSFTKSTFIVQGESDLVICLSSPIVVAKLTPQDFFDSIFGSVNKTFFTSDIPSQRAAELVKGLVSECPAKPKAVIYAVVHGRTSRNKKWQLIKADQSHITRVKFIGDQHFNVRVQSALVKQKY